MSDTQTKPILLFNDECAVCRRIAHWVRASADQAKGGPSLIVQPIGDDPAALLAMRPPLDIWDAYEVLHLVMPDGSTKLGGQAVAEVLRSLPRCKWFAWTFALRLFGVQPFQRLLDAAYWLLASVRPILGCESCGTPNAWMKAVRAFTKLRHPSQKRTPHFTHKAGMTMNTTQTPSTP